MKEQAPKTDADVAEAMYGYYLKTGSYGSVARKFKVPYTTAYTVVRRTGGDRLVEARTAMRVDLAKAHWRMVKKLLGRVKAKSEEMTGLEAAKSLEAIGRIANILDPAPKDVEAVQKPQEIHVHVHDQPDLPRPVTQDTTSTATSGGEPQRTG